MQVLADRTVIFVTVLFIVLLLFLIFWYSRFRKFSPNEYIIWLRRGKVRRSRTGGSGMLFPLLDEIIVLPTTLQLSEFEFEVNDYIDVTNLLVLEVVTNWRISNPEIFYVKIPTNDTVNLTNNKSIIELFTSSFKDYLIDKDLNFILKRSRALLNELREFSNKKAENFGIIIETLDIINVKKD